MIRMGNPRHGRWWISVKASLKMRGFLGTRANHETHPVFAIPEAALSSPLARRIARIRRGPPCSRQAPVIHWEKSRTAGYSSRHVLSWSALVVRDCLTWRRLKKVAVDDHFLYVSDYSDSKQVAIPFGDIVRVTQRHGRTLRTVTVYLRAPSEFGERIQFQPQVEKGEWGWAWQENRVVHELRKLANVQTEKV